jgi:hypothetical protein
MIKALLALAAIKVFLPVVLLVEQNQDALQEAMNALAEALSHGELNPVLAVVAGLAVVATLVLKALGKQIPLVDPIIKAALQITRKVSKKEIPPEATPGTAKVIEISKLGRDDK